MRFATDLVDGKGWHYSWIFVVAWLFNLGAAVAFDSRVDWVLTASWFECNFAESFHLLFHGGHGALVLLVHLDSSVAEVVYMLLELVHEAIHLGGVAITEIRDFGNGLLKVICLVFVFLFFVKLAPFFYFRLWGCIQVWDRDHQFVHVGVEVCFELPDVKFLWVA
jgi:hypothetical protein